MKIFILNDDEFLLEYGYDGNRTFRLQKKLGNSWVDLQGDQKRYLIMKLQQLIQASRSLSEEVKDEIMSYEPGRVSEMKSNELAKILNDLV